MTTNKNHPDMAVAQTSYGVALKPGVEQKDELKAALVRAVEAGNGYAMSAGVYKIDGVDVTRIAPYFNFQFGGPDYLSGHPITRDLNNLVRVSSESGAANVEQSSEAGRTLVAASMTNHAPHHCNFMRLNVFTDGIEENVVDGVGAGSTGIYGRITTSPFGGWFAFYHAESRFDGVDKDLVIGFNLEHCSYSKTGELIGFNAQLTGGKQAVHPITKDLPVSHGRAVAYQVTGNKKPWTADPTYNKEIDSWPVGLKFIEDSIRGSGTAIQVDACELGAVLQTDVGTISTTADIRLRGPSDRAIDLLGANSINLRILGSSSEAAIQINGMAKLSFNGVDATKISLRYNPSTDAMEFLKGDVVKQSLSMV